MFGTAVDLQFRSLPNVQLSLIDSPQSRIDSDWLLAIQIQKSPEIYRYRYTYTARGVVDTSSLKKNPNFEGQFACQMPDPPTYALYRAIDQLYNLPKTPYTWLSLRAWIRGTQTHVREPIVGPISGLQQLWHLLVKVGLRRWSMSGFRGSPGRCISWQVNHGLLLLNELGILSMVHRRRSTSADNETPMVEIVIVKMVSHMRLRSSYSCP